mmetsp:Transcript_7896/g.25148  ORF Transcript_7896/g.25148 Transcript_7896/m.25148 type:complete len:269 (-) Transcript_7896:774-1580(-)
MAVCAPCERIREDRRSRSVGRNTACLHIREQRVQFVDVIPLRVRLHQNVVRIRLWSWPMTKSRAVGVVSSIRAELRPIAVVHDRVIFKASGVEPKRLVDQQFLERLLVHFPRPPGHLVSHVIQDQLCALQISTAATHIQYRVGNHAVWRHKLPLELLEHAKHLLQFADPAIGMDQPEPGHWRRLVSPRAHFLKQVQHVRQQRRVLVNIVLLDAKPHHMVVLERLVHAIGAQVPGVCLAGLLAQQTQQPEGMAEVVLVVWRAAAEVDRE